MAASIAWWSIETLKQSHRANKVEAFMNFLIPNFPGSVRDSLISVDCPTQLTCCWNFIFVVAVVDVVFHDKAERAQQGNLEVQCICLGPK